MKIKATLTATWEYEVRTEAYPPNSSKDDILRIDKEVIEARPEEFIWEVEEVKVDLEMIEE